MTKENYRIDVGRKTKRICLNCIILPEFGMSWRVHDVDGKMIPELNVQNNPEIEVFLDPNQKPDCLQTGGRGSALFIQQWQNSML